jgi:hypothetical protein
MGGDETRGAFCVVEQIKTIWFHFNVYFPSRSLTDSFCK